MNIILSTNEKYIRYAGVMLSSLCTNNPVHIDAYVLNGGGLSDSIGILKSSLKSYDIDLYDIVIDGTDFLRDCPSNLDWTVEMYYRLFVPWCEKISVDRAIYLDVDIIVNASLEELYNSDFEGNDLIAAQDCNGEIRISEMSDVRKKMFSGRIDDTGYFNSGMMLLNLAQIRMNYEPDVYEKAIIQWEYQMSAPDQDILNYVHAGKVKYCNWEKYDLFARNAHKSGIDYETVKKTAAIIHYAGQKPWNSTDQIHYDIEKLWWDYALETSFGEELSRDYIAQSTLDESIELTLRDVIRQNDELTGLNTKLKEFIERINTANEDSTEDAHSEQCKLSGEFLEYSWPEKEAEIIWDNPLTEVNYDLCIIIPCYNQEKYIEQCIDSVIKQEHGYKVKIVVIDDGSTDSSPVLIDKYTEFENIVIIHQPNAGVSAARNSGLKEADSRYVFFLDGDDFIADGAIAVMLNEAIKLDADVIEYGFQEILYDATGEFVSQIETDIVTDDQSELVPASWNEMSGYAWGKIIRRHLFDRICFPEKYWFEDSIVKGLVIPCGRSLYKSENRVYNYRLNIGGATQQTIGNVRAVESLYIMEKTILAHEQLGVVKDTTWIEYLMGWIALTYVRTLPLDATIRTAVFFKTAEVIRKYCDGIRTDSDHLKLLEKGLDSFNFNMYCQGCVLAWNNMNK